MITQSGKFEEENIKDLVASVFAELDREDTGLTSAEANTAPISVVEFCSAVSQKPHLLKLFETCFS